jgi:ABC-type multidrug transport system ATPase subunit
MDYMRKLAQMKRTIICSIHQPRQAIWELFTKVEVLSEGHLMYTGPTEGAVIWFGDKLKYTYNPTEDGTPCDWILDLVSVSFAGGSHHSPGMADLQEVERAAAKFCKEELPGVVSANAFTLRADETQGETSLRLHQFLPPFSFFLCPSNLFE